MKEKIEDFKRWWKFNVTYKWYSFRRGVKNLWNYFPIVWKSGDFDYHYILRMQKFQLERLLKVLENGYEVDESRLPKIEDIKRCIELINNLLEDNFAERCGYKSDRITVVFEPLNETLDGEPLYQMVNKHPKPQSKEELSKIFKKSRKLEEKEWNELWSIVSKGKHSQYGMNSWWD